MAEQCPLTAHLISLIGAAHAQVVFAIRTQLGRAALLCIAPSAA